MGVPLFYRWLTNKYPNVTTKAIEERGVLDTTLPNPNGIEFDNLYLDMNGIIHPCFHPEDHECPPETFEHVFNNIFEYIDHLFSIIRPRKLLYMAIDGVAPRAKMNQQRLRRFRTAKDKEIAEAEEDKLRAEFEMEGKPVLPKHETEVSDSNIITPGTEFMYRLSEALRSYITSRISNDRGWRNIKVILSDANVPGEGEHKIMSFIRHQRNVTTYDPNTRHCLYGLDADLIMLALAVHEVHFSILREDVQQQGQQQIQGSSNMTNKSTSLVKKPYELLHIWILRHYLELDIKAPVDSNPPDNMKIDLERIVDDFIFMCFFAGNDFLPHMPSLDIHEGSIDLLISVYKKEFKNLGGYLVNMSQDVENKNMGYIKLSRVEKFILLVGSYEEKIFKKRLALRERKLKQLCNYSDEIIDQNTKELKEKLKHNLRKNTDLFKQGVWTDKVRLGTLDWKQRYYKEKFPAESSQDIGNQKKELVTKYTEGLLWVLLYYFSGVPSWTWFYPYHYAPFASDMKGLAQVRVKFKKGSPFKPFDQLLAVLPPKSAHALPKVYQALLTDEGSRIIDFYPTVNWYAKVNIALFSGLDFDIDTDGKRFMWQGICKLPFIEEGRLLSETKELDKDLLEVEAVRNKNSVDQLYLSSTQELASQILALSFNQKELVEIDTAKSDGIGGFIRLSDQDTEMVQRKVKNNDEENCVLCVSFETAAVVVHIPRLLEGVKLPEKNISEADLMEAVLWHEYEVNKPPNKLMHGRGFVRNSAEATFKVAGNGRGMGRGKVNNSFNRREHVECSSGPSWTSKSIHEGYEGYGRRFTSDASSEVIYKGAGNGWGAGRGPGNTGLNGREHIESTRWGIPHKDAGQVNTGLNSREHIQSTSWGMPHKDAGKGWGAGRGQVNTSLNSREHIESTRWGIPHKDAGNGWEDGKVSSPVGSSSNLKQQARPYGRAQPINNSFRPGVDGVTYGTNNAWRPSTKYGSYSGNHQGRGQHGSTDSARGSGSHYK
ncbi:5'-3' exoribonuclease 4 [Morella rubra]|uniref:5'-3' exoribonuclease 4 n=1 Tax=Morella rubra TaxID=262757 RepID=A0A6A1WQY1_9ROSI|nr:5'-3' exoribonuclease 4 [Morella rubra]